MDIKTDIFECGKTLFSTQGFKKTNIKEIAQAGVAVGTFYNYFASKDQLFLEIYVQENEKLKQWLIESIDVDQQPVDVIHQLLMRNQEAIHASPILQEWYGQQFYRKLEQHYHYENSKIVDSFRGFFVDLLKSWQAQGKIRADIDEALLPVFFDSLVCIDAHKDELGLQHYPQIILHLADFIMQGLTRHYK